MKRISFIDDIRHSTILIIIGFCLVLMLISGVMLVSFKQVSSLADKQHHIEQDTHLKQSLILSMHNIIRDRTLSMFAISMSQDPFDKDEELMRFQAMAGRFIQLRLQLESMRLSVTERRLLERAKAIIRHTAPVQEQIVNGLVYGKAVNVQRFMQHDRPMEMRLLAVFGELANAVQQSGRDSVGQTQADYRPTYWSILMLGAAAMIIFIMIVRFVTGRIGFAENALFREKEQLEVTLKSIGDAVITVDENSVVTYLNPVAEHLTGCSNRQALGWHLSEVYRTVREDTGEWIQHPAFATQLHAQVVGLHRYSVLRAHNGLEHIIEDNTSPIYDKQDKLIGKVLVFRDMSHARKIERQLSWQARHDPLTGLANRLEFEAHLDELVDNAARSGNEHVLLYIDLDEFKAVNDHSGHAGGDALLQKLSAEMEQCIRRSDVIARLGGDEFAVLLNSCDRQQGRDIAENILRRVAHFKFEWHGIGHRVGVSIGMVSINAHSGTPADVLHIADIACYNAKAQGKNCIWAYEQLVSDIIPMYVKQQ